jgi:hypothetical protein
MFMPAACTFDSLAINLNSALAEVAGPQASPLTVTLMDFTPGGSTITGPSAAISTQDFALAQLTATGTGSMAAPAGSYVWLQISGSALKSFPVPSPGLDGIPAGLIEVVSHCN